MRKAARLKEMAKPLSAHRVVLASFAVDFLDVVLNLAVAILSSSAVMLAESLQGASDLLATGLLLIGLRQAKRPGGRKYPYGRGRELYFWTLISTLVMLAGSATMSVWSGLQHLLHPVPLQSIPLALAVVLVGLVSNSYALSLSLRRLHAPSPELKLTEAITRSPYIETKVTLVLDLMGTVSATFGLIALLATLMTGNVRYDGFGAIVIGLTIATLAWLLAVEVKELLIGRAAGSTALTEIRRAVLSVPEVKDIVDLQTMYLGPEQILIDVEITLATCLSTRTIEGVIRRIQTAVKAKVPAASQVHVGLDRPQKA